MKKAIFTILLGVFVFSLSAQTDVSQLQNKITTLESSNTKLTSQVKANQKAVNDLTIQLKAANDNILQLQTALATNQIKLDELTVNYDKRISQTEKSSTEQFEHLGKSLSQNTIFWIIAFLAVGFISYFLYRRLRGRLSTEKAAIYNEIKSGNEQLKADLSALITKNVDDLKHTFTGEIKDLDDKQKKSVTDMRTDFEEKFKQTSENIKATKEKMEAEFQTIKTEKKQPKAEIS